MDSATVWLAVGAIGVPILSAIGSWIGVRVAIAVIQVRVQGITEKVDSHGTRLDLLNEDSLIHDVELETAFTALKLPRARRQRVRD